MANTKSKRPKRGKDGQYHVQKYIGRRADGSRYYKWFHNKDWNALPLLPVRSRMRIRAGRKTSPSTKR